MNLGHAFRIVLASAFAGTILGGVLGAALGLLLPNYYRSTFGGPIDPLQTGLGLGISQGLVAGGAIGAFVLAVVSWREVRLREIESRRAGDYPRPNA